MNIAQYEKAHYATQENVLTWCISMYHVNRLKQPRGIKNSRKIRGCRGLLGVVIP